MPCDFCRIFKRPLAATAELENVMDTFIYHKDSIMQAASYSLPFQQVLIEFMDSLVTWSWFAERFSCASPDAAV